MSVAETWKQVIPFRLSTTTYYLPVTHSIVLARNLAKEKRKPVFYLSHSFFEYPFLVPPPAWFPLLLWDITTHTLYPPYIAQPRPKRV